MTIFKQISSRNLKSLLNCKWKIMHDSHHQNANDLNNLQEDDTEGEYRWCLCDSVF